MNTKQFILTTELPKESTADPAKAALPGGRVEFGRCFQPPRATHGFITAVSLLAGDGWRLTGKARHSLR